jgi:hypothetical protein
MASHTGSTIQYMTLHEITRIVCAIANIRKFGFIWHGDLCALQNHPHQPVLRIPEVIQIPRIPELFIHI